MSKLVWDEASKRMYQTGVSDGVFYKQATDGTYPKGVAWNGLTQYTESPSGADETKLYADNIKYLSIRAAEDLGATIACYDAPDEFLDVDGTTELITGVRVHQQVRKSFGFVCKTIVGNDVDDNDFSYKIHILYNCSVSPSERGYATVNESPEAITLSYTVSTTPIKMPNGAKASALITIDAWKFTTTEQKAALKALEDVLFGADNTYAETTDATPQAGVTYYTRSGAGTAQSPYVYTEFEGSTFEQGTTYYVEVVNDARLPLPEEIITILGGSVG